MVTHTAAHAQPYLGKPVRIVVCFAQGIERAGGGVHEFLGYLKSEISKWAKVITLAAIPPP